MKSSNDYKKTTNFGALLIGPPKSGKTRLALSFPKPAVLDCDGNLAGALRAGVGDFIFEDPNVDDNGHELTPDKSWEKSMAFMKEAVSLPKEQCETIVIDGLSILTNYLVDSLSRYSKLIVAGEKVMDMQLWQPFRNKMQQFILAGRACDKRFIVTCHEDVVTDINTGSLIGYRPLIPGQLKQNMAGLFSDVWRCEATAKGLKQQYTIRFAPKTMMQIGNSLGITDAELDVTNKSPQEIWDYLKQYL